jgi:pimeloyl-ACP methyl ester carboxylesterase
MPEGGPMFRLCTAAFVLSMLFASPARAESSCDPDGVQASGSIYRICMPPAAEYNGILVIWAHGFQDAGTRVGIPEDQLCLPDFCLQDVITSLGFGFATNSYSKTGLAVLQGLADVVDLVNIFTSKKGLPRKVYLVGASEGGIITALGVERHPDVFNGGVAACGPVGSFPSQINYFGDARVTFEYFFPGLIPGDPFNPDAQLIANWSDYYERVVKPVVFDPAHRHELDQWVAVANLPFDEDNYLGTVALSVRDALRYAVVNVIDGTATLGGFPFENRKRWYAGSDDDARLNKMVIRAAADAAAVQQMNTAYRTTGLLLRPLMTLHTRKDQQVPYWHEPRYNLKTLATGALLRRHLNIPIDRFGHCNFTRDEALFAFAVMLFYDGTLGEVIGTGAFLSGAAQASFEQRAGEAGLPTRREGSRLTFTLKE